MPAISKAVSLCSRNPFNQKHSRQRKATTPVNRHGYNRAFGAARASEEPTPPSLVRSEEPCTESEGGNRVENDNDGSLGLDTRRGCAGLCAKLVLKQHILDAEHIGEPVVVGA